MEEDIKSLEGKKKESAETIEKVQADLKVLEKERVDLSKGATSGEKEKLFFGKIQKMNTEIQHSEARLKALNKAKDELELKLEHSRREIKDV